jgi:hypothetical protein
VRGEKPEGVKTQEGIERRTGPNTPFGATDRCPDQSPEGEAVGAGHRGNSLEAKIVNDRRAQHGDES